MNPIITAVIQALEAQRTEALARVHLYMNNPVGVPDHNNFVSEAANAVKSLAEAEAAIITLQKLLPVPQEEGQVSEEAAVS